MRIAYISNNHSYGLQYMLLSEGHNVKTAVLHTPEGGQEELLQYEDVSGLKQLFPETFRECLTIDDAVDSDLIFCD